MAEAERVIVVGAGGHARVVIDALRAAGVEPLGAVSTGGESAVAGVPVLGDDEAVARYPAAEVRLANGIGTVRADDRRRRIFERFAGAGYRFVAVVHPAATVASDATLGQGAQIMAGAVVQTGTCIGSNVIVNTAASVDHDCAIGDHVHIGPGVTMSGSVSVGEGAHIGVGATVIQGVRIGPGCTVGAGAVVLADLDPGRTYVGVPATVRR